MVPASISMLQVLYKDLVTDANTLHKATKMHDLLKYLYASGNLSPTDFSVLYDTINITGQYAYQPNIMKLLPLFQNVRNFEISKFSLHRQKLVKLGIALTQNDVAKLDGVYNLPPKNYEDSWHLIQDLEHRGVICEGKMKKFIGKLSALQFHHLVKALLEGIPDEDYHLLFLEISNWYDEFVSIGMLKVLYRDYMTDSDLQCATQAFDLLSILHDSGNLSPTDLGILYDTINITKQYGFRPKNKKLLPLFQNVRNFEISKFKLHRQSIVKLGMVLIPGDVEKIGDAYNMPTVKYEDSWHLIQDLEKRGTICEGKMKKFIDKLSALQLHHALKVVPEVVDKMSQELSEDSDKEQETQLMKSEKEENDLATESTSKKFKGELPEDGCVEQGVASGLVSVEEDLANEPTTKMFKGELPGDVNVKHNVGSSTSGITAFRQILAIVSEWYDHHGYIRMLKVLYRDCVDDYGKLIEASVTMELMNLLITSGKLNSKDLSILCDTIKATDTFGLLNEIERKIPSCLIIRDEKISKFTHHRQKVMKLGMALWDEDVVKISQLYPIENGYEDSWSLIMDLEYRTIIQKGKMKAFIDKMEENELVQAVKALTEDISVASSNTVVGFGEEEIDDNDLQKLLPVFTEWYDNIDYTSRLKVLYRDLIKNAHLLNKASSTNDLLNLLITSGNMHSTVLKATMKATDTFGLEYEIEQKIPSCPKLRDVRDVRIFSPHRRKLLKFGMVLVHDNIERIKGLYNEKLKGKDYQSRWSLIMDLEHQMIICEGKMEAFIADLKDLELPQAIEVLTEGIRKVSQT
ncbi:uncharacterized protein LOC117101039 [Anneissia japonica]|uniref:uncharacterized protein LOC117101039 n=1 Tax=Anneissia japonica TaxID=1529436 RepID=UPI0014255E63|nr:uncharacterized protein LOC117101039 [Anneissia japonica]